MVNYLDTPSEQHPISLTGRAGTEEVKDTSRMETSCFGPYDDLSMQGAPGGAALAGKRDAAGSPFLIRKRSQSSKSKALVDGELLSGKRWQKAKKAHPLISKRFFENVKKVVTQ